MSAAFTTELLPTLENAQAEIRDLSRATDQEVRTLGDGFEKLAGQAENGLKAAREIVACIEGEAVSSVALKVQSLCETVKRFIAEKLQGLARLLDLVTMEATLLRRLTSVTDSQAAIASQTKTLSVLTNIEVARLGSVGTDFAYLARELSGFSRSVSEDIEKLRGHTEKGRSDIEAMRRALAVDLARLRKETERIEQDLTKATMAVGSSLSDLLRTPGEFQACVQDIAQQIGGVVAAVQAYDITRQETEHVLEALEALASALHGARGAEEGLAEQTPEIYAGLTIQAYQLKNIKETVANWTSQVGNCTASILQVSASGVVSLGPMVLRHEGEVTSQLAEIGSLLQDSQASGERIRRTLGRLSGLSQLVAEHLQRTESVRHKLQLITFNSVIEASRLGKQGDTILAIANCIKETSAEWNLITDQSGLALAELRKLVDETDQAMGASSTSDGQLREAEIQARTALEGMRTAGAQVEKRAHEINGVTEAMQKRVAEVSATVDLLRECSQRLDSVTAQIENVTRKLEADVPDVKVRYDPAKIEQRFSASYTTEIERTVLQAALHGGAMPAPQQVLTGNDVELF